MTDNQPSGEEHGETKISPQIHASHIDVPPTNVQSIAVTSSDEVPGSFSKDPHQAEELKEILENFDPLTIGGNKEKTNGLIDETKSDVSRLNIIESTSLSSNGDQNESIEPEMTENDPEKKFENEPITGISISKVSANSETSANPSEPDFADSSSLNQSNCTQNSETRSNLSKYSSEKSINEIPKDDNLDRPFDFQKFLELLRHKSADPIARYVKSFLYEFNKRPWTVTEQLKIIGDFKIFISEKMAFCPPFNTLSEHEMRNATEGMEKLIMNRLYNKVFSPEIPLQVRSGGHEEDVIRDNVLEEKLHIWNWIQGRHLDIEDRFLKNGNSFVKLASDELIKMNHYRAPRDKVICILNCCKVIFGLLRQTNNEESADGFLPILIFVIIKAQPKDLISNINYIQRFRDPDMLAGEAGYYISSLIGAVSFIEQLDRSQLSITDEEFEQNVELSVQHIVAPIKAQEATSAKTSGESSIDESKFLSDSLHPPITPKRASTPNDEVEESTSTAAASQAVGLNASQVLYSSAGLFTAPFRSLSKLFESDPANGDASKSDKKDVLIPEELAARQVSAEEEEARRIHQREFENVAETLKQMFPSLDKDIIEDVLRSKDSRVGAAVDACLTLVS